MITNHSLEMLDQAVDGGKPFFLAVAPAIPHVGIAANGSGTFLPVPVPKWANAFSDKTVPNKTSNFNPNRVSCNPRPEATYSMMLTRIRRRLGR